jgi:acyl-homoserine-lactone acylase
VARAPLWAGLFAALALAASGTALAPSTAPAASLLEIERWELRARAVTITRDDWGIAHVKGKSDADAVFGMLYAQAEDDFPRIEANYLSALGRLAEADGETAIFQDLRMKLFVDPDTLQALYRGSPAWLRNLMDAFADGLNFYLHQHPEVKPRVLTRFEPWMALAFTEGSIGGDIERIDVRELAAFYGDSAAAAPALARDALPGKIGGKEDALLEPDGSNGIAIGPALTRARAPLLLINPHTTFYFRSELHVTSAEGLDTYGAVTWGQFFVYQGFNRTCGWMHTSSGVDNIDEFLETVVKRGDRLHYHDGASELPLEVRTLRVPYRTVTGMRERAFTVYGTRRGPVVRRAGEKWVSVSLMHEPVRALTQSFQRTKARDLASFRRVMQLHGNSSNNTVFADARGNIAYFHSNYIPRRDTTFDWTRPVEGSDPATAYRGLHSLEESPNAINPSTSWVYNSNNWPWSAAGTASPVRAAFPRYVETGVEESARGWHALGLLEPTRDWTLESLAAAAFDSRLPAFERLLPRLFEAYDQVPSADTLRARVVVQLAMLRAWDMRWGAASVPTTLAVHWGEELLRRVEADAREARVPAQAFIAEHVAPQVLVGALADVSDSLTAAFGTWKVPWGEVNRFQRIGNTIPPRFDDSGPSLAVPFTSGIWGSLAAFNARRQPGTRRRYGTSGNTFVAVVEFGHRVRAVAVTAGGASGDPASPHFVDQAERFVSGRLRDVRFHPEDVRAHTRRVYQPGH